MSIALILAQAAVCIFILAEFLNIKQQQDRDDDETKD